MHGGLGSCKKTLLLGAVMEIVPCHASLSQRSDLKAGLLEDKSVQGSLLEGVSWALLHFSGVEQGSPGHRQWQWEF